MKVKTSKAFFPQAIYTRHLKKKLKSRFVVRFYGLSSCYISPVPKDINDDLNAATSPEEIEVIISENEARLAQLLNPCDEFLVCDSAAELISDVLSSKGIKHSVICGINDEGNSHSYIKAGEKYYDPTHQGYGQDKM